MKAPQQIQFPESRNKMSSLPVQIHVPSFIYVIALFYCVTLGSGFIFLYFYIGLYVMY
jgi:hypothetical protein